MHIQTILFDTDGVIQRPSAHRRGAWQQLLGQGRDVDEFVAAVFEVEREAARISPVPFQDSWSNGIAREHCKTLSRYGQ